MTYDILGSPNKKSKKNWALFLIALCCFTTNMCFSARDGYLAHFAKEANISGFVYGLFKANYIVGYVLMGCLNKSLLRVLSARAVILLGIFGHGICLILAGMIYYLLIDVDDSTKSKKVLFQVLTCVFQALQGGMMSSVTLSSLSLGSSYFSDDMSKVNGTYYLGAVIPHGIVPVLANYIYNAMGYAFPLYFFGVFAFVLSFLAYVIFIVNDFDFKFEEETSGSISTLPKRIFIPLVQSYILTAYLSYLQLAIPKFSMKVLGFSLVQASTPLFVLMMFIAFVNIIITYVLDHAPKHILRYLLCACVCDAVAAFLLFPREGDSAMVETGRVTVYLLVCVIGTSDAYSTINTTPAMNYLFSTARTTPPTPSQQHTMSSLWIAGNGLSYAVGAYSAGFIDEVFHEDFHRAGFLWGCLTIVCVLSLIFPVACYNTSAEQYKLIRKDTERGAISPSSSDDSLG